MNFSKKSFERKKLLITPTLTLTLTDLEIINLAQYGNFDSQPNVGFLPAVILFHQFLSPFARQVLDLSPLITE